MLALAAAALPGWGAAAAAPPAPPPPLVPAAVRRVTVHADAGVTSYLLTNGVGLHVRPSARTQRVFVAVFVPGVELDETEATRGQTLLGRAALSLPQTAGRLRVLHKEEGLFFTLETAPGDLRADLDQLATMLAEPVTARESFDPAKERLLDAARAAEAGEHAALVRALVGAAVKDPGARFFPPTAAQIAAVTFEQASARIAAVLAARTVDVAVCGDVVGGDVAATGAAAFGKLAERPRDRLAHLRLTGEPDGPLTVELVGSAPAFTLVAKAPPVAEAERAHAAALAGEMIKDELPALMREAGVAVPQALGVAVAPGRLFPRGGLGACTWLGAGAENDPAAAAGAARAALGQVPARLSDPEIARRIDRLAGSIEDQQRSSEWWSLALASAWFLDRPIDRLAREPAMIRGLTPDRVRDQLVQTWVDGVVRTIVVRPGP